MSDKHEGIYLREREIEREGEIEREKGGGSLERILAGELLRRPS